MSPGLRAWLRERAHQALAATPSGWRAEVYLRYHERSVTRFTRNEVHQHMHDADGQAQIALYSPDARWAVVRTNRLDDEGLAQAVARAVALAALREPDPEWPGLTPAGRSYPAAEAWDEATANLPPQARVQSVREIVAVARQHGLQAAGVLRNEARAVLYAHGEGLEAFQRGTQAEAVVVMQADDEAWGRAQDAAGVWARLDPVALAREAATLAVRGRRPRPLPPGEYPVVLSPYAVADLLHMLNLHGLSAQAVHEGRSWLVGRLGEPTLDPRLQVTDDPLARDMLPQAFDGEGTPKARLPLVRDGVPLTPVYDRRTGAQAGRASTGHGQPPAWRAWGPLAGHLRLQPGDADQEALLASISRGLFVNRFWYTRLVHPRDAVVTGMTRDGVFWVEGGEVAYPVKNLRFTQSYVQALAQVLAVGRETRLVLTGSAAVRAPGLALPAFRFTGRTA